MKERLIAAVKEIRDNKSLPIMDEASHAEVPDTLEGERPYFY